MKFEALLAQETQTSEDIWNLSEWSCYESLDRFALVQQVSDCFLENRLPAAEFYPLENVMLLALYEPTIESPQVQFTTEVELSTRLGLTNFLENLAPINVREVIQRPASAFPERPSSPIHTVAYDIGDFFYKMNVLQTQFHPTDGSVLDAVVTKQTEIAQKAVLSLRKVCVEKPFLLTEIYHLTVLSSDSFPFLIFCCVMLE